METQNRIDDINGTGIFNDVEVEQDKGNCFKSWEYNVIVHLTDEELYYYQDDHKHADRTEQTEKGIIYCYS